MTKTATQELHSNEEHVMTNAHKQVIDRWCSGLDRGDIDDIELSK
jgi:hypothetical protein